MLKITYTHTHTHTHTLAHPLILSPVFAHMHPPIAVHKAITDSCTDAIRSTCQKAGVASPRVVRSDEAREASVRSLLTGQSDDKKVHYFGVCYYTISRRTGEKLLESEGE